MTAPSQEKSPSDLEEKITTFRKRGFTDEQIYEGIAKSERYAPKIQKLRDQGISDEAIQSRIFANKSTQQAPNEPEQAQEPSKGFWSDLFENVGRGAAMQSKIATPPVAETVEAGKSLLSGATLGLSENVPIPATSLASQALSTFFPDQDTSGLEKLLNNPLKIDESKLGAGAKEALETVGELLPITGIFKGFNTLGQMALKQIPGAGKAVRSLVRLLESGLSGATVESAQQFSDYLGGEEMDANKIIERGGEWMVLDALFQLAGGAATPVVRNLVKVSEKLGVPIPNLIEKTVDLLKAEKIIPDNLFINPKIVAELPKDEADKITKLFGDTLGQVETDLAAAPKVERQIPVKQETPDVLAPREASPVPKQEVPKPVAPAKVQEKRIRAQEIDLKDHPIPQTDVGPREEINPFAVSVTEESAPNLGPRYDTRKEFGEGMQFNINANIKRAKDSYEPKYKAAKAEMKDIRANPNEAAKIVEEGIKSIERFKVRPQGYEKARRDLYDIISDFGFGIEAGENGELKRIVVPKELEHNADDLVELSKRVSELADYDTLEPSTKKVFNRIAAALKSDAKAATESKSKNALKLFNQAEAEYARNAQRLGRKNIVKIRKLEDTEQVASMIEGSTALADLKAVMDPKQFKEVERELFENLVERSPKQIRKFLKENDKLLSNEFKQITNDLIIEKELNEFIEQKIGGSKLSSQSLSDLGTNQKFLSEVEQLAGAETRQFFEEMASRENQMRANLDASIKEQARIIERNARKEEARRKLESITGKISKASAADRKKQMAQQVERGEVLLGRQTQKEKTRLERVKAREAEIKGRMAAANKSTAPKGRGEQLLLDAAKKRHPYKALLEEHMQFLDLSEKKIAAVVIGGLLGGPKGVVGALAISAGPKVAQKVFYRLMYSKTAQRAYKEMVNVSRKDPKAFIQAYDKLIKILNEDL